ncbi:DUF7064 domain-containing protein [Nocardiopsis oceani]
MIKSEDVDFHTRDPEDWSWTETTALIFAVPEAGILGNAYVLARPNLGVALSSICLAQGICRQPYEIDFTDCQVHLPCPDNFTNYTLPNGLSVEVRNPPRDYHLTYEHNLGTCSFDLNFQALHDPFDMHDPEQNALLTEADGKATLDTRGDGWATGHFETKGHITGTLTLHGQEYAVDCYEGMDHSWGPRRDLGTWAVAWISVNFGPAFSMHLAVDERIDPDGEVRYGDLRFGYVTQHGETRSLVSATVEATRVEMLAMSNVIRVTDSAGTSWEFRGTAIAAHPFHAFNPRDVAYQSLMRYEHDGIVGTGEMADILGLDYLAKHKSRHGKRAQA